jgi:hypothetical protein
MRHLNSKVLLLGISAAMGLNSQTATPSANLASWGFLTPYNAAITLDSPSRAARNALYDGMSGEGALSDNSKHQPLAYSPYVDLLDLVPIGQADAAALGTVTAGKSHLSNDRTTVYSEMQFQVSQVLFNTARAALSVGASVPTLRAGGGGADALGVTAHPGMSYGISHCCPAKVFSKRINHPTSAG